jgi:hypothetical protein
MNDMRRLARLIAELPEAVRVDVETWGDHPTFAPARSPLRR